MQKVNISDYLNFLARNCPGQFMPDLHISEAPAMIRRLVAARAFADDPIVVVDVGARGEIEPFWSVFGDQIRMIGFEPDPSECERLNAEAGPNVCYLPIALSSDVGEATFYTTKHAASSSFYKADPASTARFNFAQNLAVQSEVSLQTSTLAIALGDRKPDFIKLDAEGAELKILRGANLDTVLGILSEVNFLSAGRTFSELDVFCRDAGFQLYDLDLYRFSRSALPYPFLYDFREEDGRPCAGPTIQGQLLTGDALYFLDGVRTRQPLKLACLFELFGLNDCAAEVIISHDLDRQLLEFLTPKVKGTNFSYAEYVRRSQANDARFRPTYPYRFPECVLGRYDGTFTPRWHPLSRLIAFLNRMFKC